MDLDIPRTQRYCCVVIPEFDETGNLPPGVHPAGWEEIQTRFGTTPWRTLLLEGLHRALKVLSAVGCTAVYLDGSFVTSKTAPSDYDACYSLACMDLAALMAMEPAFFDFRAGRAAQKAKFRGEFFPAELEEALSRRMFLDFLQRDKDTGDPKGIVAVDPRSLP